MVKYKSTASKSCSIELGDWIVIGKAPNPRSEPSAARFNGKLYLANGMKKGLVLVNGMDIYDASSNEWTKNVEVPFIGIHEKVAEYNNSLYYIGGSKGRIPNPKIPAEGYTTGLSSDHVRRFDPVTGTWHSLTNMPRPRAAGVAFVDRFGLLHYVSGLSEIRQITVNDHWALDLNDINKGWITKSNLPGTGRVHIAIATIDDWVYFIGGVTDHEVKLGDDSKLVYAYNIVTDAWRRKADLPFALSHSEGATMVVEGYILIIGGRSNTYSRMFDVYVKDDILLYDPAKDEWSELKRFPTPIFGGAGGYFQNIKVNGVLGNYVIITGGEYIRMLYDVRASKVSVKCKTENTS
jgi:N-acetylneuraminic acid mutarotase